MGGLQMHNTTAGLHLSSTHHQLHIPHKLSKVRVELHSNGILQLSPCSLQTGHVWRSPPLIVVDDGLMLLVFNTTVCLTITRIPQAEQGESGVVLQRFCNLHLLLYFPPCCLPNQAMNGARCHQWWWMMSGWMTDAQHNNCPPPSIPTYTLSEQGEAGVAFQRLCQPPCPCTFHVVPCPTKLSVRGANRNQ